MPWELNFDPSSPAKAHFTSKKTSSGTANAPPRAGEHTAHDVALCSACPSTDSRSETCWRRDTRGALHRDPTTPQFPGHRAGRVRARKNIHAAIAHVREHLDEEGRSAAGKRAGWFVPVSLQRMVGFHASRFNFVRLLILGALARPSPRARPMKGSARFVTGGCRAKRNA